MVFDSLSCLSFPCDVSHCVFFHSSCTTVFISGEDDVSLSGVVRANYIDSQEGTSPPERQDVVVIVASYQKHKSIWAQFNNSEQ